MKILKALGVRDVVREHYAHGAPVVRGRDGPEALLPRCMMRGQKLVSGEGTEHIMKLTVKNRFKRGFSW